MKKITIFTSTYNRAKLLKNAYNSLKNQSNKNFIWMIIDDGSTDSTEKIVEEFITENIIDVEYYKKDNGGKHSAYNEMLKYLKTEYVLISLDSDDTLLPNAIEILENKINYIKENNCGIVTPRFINNGKKMTKKYKSLIGKQISLKDALINNKLDIETELLFKSDYLKKFKFPIIKGEKFFTEAYIYYQMDEKMLWCKETISIDTYQSDGLTKNMMKNFKENPISWYLYNKLRMEENLSWKYKIKYCIYMISFGIFIKAKIISNSRYKFLTTLLYPIGYLGYFYIKKKGK